MKISKKNLYDIIIITVLLLLTTTIVNIKRSKIKDTITQPDEYIIVEPLSRSINSKKKKDIIKVKKVLSVYDGDTFRADLFLKDPIVKFNMPIRIYGIDTPEIRGTSGKVKQLAIVSKLYVKNKLLNAKEIILVNPQRCMYFRIIAEVIVDDVNLGEELINLKYAKRYYGGSKDGLWDNTKL